MTAIEWIELAQEKIKDAACPDWRFNNIACIQEAIKCLNEAKAIIKETNEQRSA